MKQAVRILHLYPDLLDLYGDGGNLLVMRRRLEQAGVNVTVDRQELGARRDPREYDLILAGAGKTRNLAAAMTDLAQDADALRRAVEAGVTVLATGSGMVLLGNGLQVGGDRLPGVGLFDYTAEETGQVTVTEGVLRLNGLDEPLYGFANQTVKVTYPTPPDLFTVVQGTVGQNGGEGRICRNAFATTLLGPLLVKNPALCRLVLTRAAGEDLPAWDDALARLAWQRTLAEFDGVLA